MDSTSIGLYHTFSVVAEAGSISKAAKELFISQPAVSKAIKRLESKLETSLFIRTSRGIRLTNEGRTLYEYIQNAFETIAAGEDSIKRMTELGIGHIKIGVSSTLCKHILLPLLKDFLKLHPHTQITISCQSTANTIHFLENKEIDIGLIAKTDSTKNLTCMPCGHYGHISDIFVAAPHYVKSLIERENITKSDILEHSSLILLDKKNVTRHYIDSYLNKWNIETKKAMEVDSMELLIDFVKTGLGAGCVIEEFITDELACGQLVKIATPSAIKQRNVCFAYNNTVTMNSAAELFIEFIQQQQQ